MTKKNESKKASSDSKIENIFELISLASKRARELISGAPKLIHEEIEDPVQIALEEIKQGKISVGKKQNTAGQKKEEN